MTNTDFKPPTLVLTPRIDGDPEQRRMRIEVSQEDALRLDAHDRRSPRWLSLTDLVTGVQVVIRGADCGADCYCDAVVRVDGIPL